MTRTRRQYTLLICVACSFLAVCTGCQVDQAGFETIGRYSIDIGYALCIQEPYLFATTNDGFEVFEMLPTGKLKHRESVKLELGAPCYAMVVRNGIAFAAGEGGLTVLDVTNLGSSRVVGQSRTGGMIQSMILDRNLLFVSDYHNGLSVFDVSDVSRPVAVGQYQTSGSSWAQAKVGEVLYLANMTNGLIALDVSDPTQPELIGAAESSAGARSIVIVGDTLWLGTWMNGLNLFDISEARDPSFIRQLFAGEEIYVQHVENGLIFCNRPEQGVVVYELKDGGNPVERGHFNTGLAHDAKLVDGLLYSLGRAVNVLRPLM